MEGGTYKIDIYMTSTPIFIFFFCLGLFVHLMWYIYWSEINWWGYLESNDTHGCREINLCISRFFFFIFFWWWISFSCGFIFLIVLLLFFFDVYQKNNKKYSGKLNEPLWQHKRKIKEKENYGKRKKVSTYKSLGCR